MDLPTGYLSNRQTVDFTSKPGRPNSVNFLWTRDGHGAPGPGAPGELLPMGEDLFSRFLRARAADEKPFVAEVRRDEVEPDDFPATWGRAGNDVLHAIWIRRCVAATAEPTPPPADLGFEEHQPLLICKEKGVMFHTPSPQTAGLGVLDDCRDEAMLSRLRLPSWSVTTSRFLMDTNAVKTTGVPQFYTAARALPRNADAPVGDWTRLVRDLGTLADPERRGPPDASGLRGQFPCIGCNQYRRCHPPGGVPTPGQPVLARKRLAPVSFHPFFAIPHREEILTYDEHVDLLGGATWQPFRTRHVQKWTAAGTRLAREKLERTAFARIEAVEPIQAVASKLALFEAAVGQVLAYHQEHGHPHLGLTPTMFASHNLHVGRDDVHDVSLRGKLRGVMLDDLMTAPPGPPMWLPPPAAEVPYAHADILDASRSRRDAPRDGDEVHTQRFQFGRGTQARITAGRVWEDGSKGTTECELDLTGPGLSSIELDPSDRIRVEIKRPGWEGVSLWCRPDTERMLGATDRPVRTFAAALKSAQVLDLKSASGRQALFGTATVYRTYGAYYDVYSLGVLLMQTLVENSKHPMTKLVEDVLPSLSSFGRAVSSSDGAEAWKSLSSVMQTVARARPLDRFLLDVNVCFFPGEVPDKERRVPAELWAELLAVIVACVTLTPGISFCKSTRLDRRASDFCKPVEALLERIRAIRKKLPKPAQRDRRPATQPQAVPEALSAAETLREENRRLKRSLEAKVARVERLESDVQALQRATKKLRGEKAPRQQDARTEAAWRALVEGLAGGRIGSVPSPNPGEPAFELVKALLVDGLETQSVLLTALAELGGHEFANEQRNLKRLVRRALRDLSEGSSSQYVNEAVHSVRAVRSTLGGAIGMLVDAHGRSTRDGTRKMLATLDTAIKKELGLKGSQLRQLEDIMSRLRGSLGDLIAMLYDPVFEDHVRRQLRQQRRG